MKNLNKVELIGNIVKDPFQNNSGGPVLFTVATNRDFKSNGLKKEEVEFNTIVCWDKLGELAMTLLKAKDLIYIEGRIHTGHKIEGDLTTEYKDIVCNDFIILKLKNPLKET